MIEILNNELMNKADIKILRSGKNFISTGLPLLAGSNSKQNQPPIKKQDEYLFIKVGYSFVKVNFKEIKYIEGFKDYIKIYSSEKALITKSTIKHAESKLPAELFTRVHKSYIISIDKIDKIEYNHIFIGQKKIPIGMLFRDAFYNKIALLRL
jgi:two-component system LytT family response regulator